MRGDSSSYLNFYECRSWCLKNRIFSFREINNTSCRSNTPVVQKRRRVSAERFASRRMWYPTVLPRVSPLSADIRAATEIADTRRGWVQIMLQSAPRKRDISSSKMNCGSCVVLPQPVSPETTNTCTNTSQILLYSRLETTTRTIDWTWAKHQNEFKHFVHHIIIDNLSS